MKSISEGENWVAIWASLRENLILLHVNNICADKPAFPLELSSIEISCDIDTENEISILFHIFFSKAKTCYGNLKNKENGCHAL